jgi:hypothetical protein
MILKLQVDENERDVGVSENYNPRVSVKDDEVKATICQDTDRCSTDCW